MLYQLLILRILLHPDEKEDNGRIKRSLCFEWEIFMNPTPLLLLIVCCTVYNERSDCAFRLSFSNFYHHFRNSLLLSIILYCYTTQFVLEQEPSTLPHLRRKEMV